MRFSQSTHLLMCLSLETLMPIIRTGLPILMVLIYLVNSYNVSVSNNLTQMINFPTRIPDWFSQSCSFVSLSSDARYLSYNGVLSIGKFWLHYCLNFHWLSIIFTMGCPISLHCLWLFLCWLGQSLLSYERCPMGGYF